MLPLFSKIKNSYLEFKNSQDSYDYKKLILLGWVFFFIIGAYSVIRPLKTSVFLGLVGKEYQPWTKAITIIMLFPILFLYAKLVDKLKRYQVILYFLGFYFVSILVLAVILIHPVIGLANTATSPYRIFGWIFYLLIDLYPALVVATFWAFANSISTNDYAKKNYGKIVAFSKMGGIITTILSLAVLKKVTSADTIKIPVILASSSVLILIAGLIIRKIMTDIPGYRLHGYEAVYQVEKEKATKEKISMFEGLKLMLTKPYVLGIFSLVYLYEAISVIFDYQMQVKMSIEANNSISGMSSFMFKYTLAFQALGLFFSFFGTSTLLKKIGVRACLFIMPATTILLSIGLIIKPTLGTIFIIMVLLRALHYGFNAPVREILYIPTTKDIKFKSKSWVDSFGRTLSKGSGSLYNGISSGMIYSSLIKLNSSIIIGLSLIWGGITYFIGKRYSDAIKKNKVIGE